MWSTISQCDLVPSHHRSQVTAVVVNDTLAMVAMPPMCPTGPQTHLHYFTYTTKQHGITPVQPI